MAYGLLLQHSRGMNGPVMLSDGKATEFSVTLDDGRTLRVPVGSIHARGAGWTEVRSPVHYLLDIDPLRRPLDPLDPFEHDKAHELIFVTGDRVIVSAEVEETADAHSFGGSYRDAPKTILLAKGIPTVEKK